MSQQELDAVLKALVDRSIKISKHGIRTFRLTTLEVRALLRVLTKGTSNAKLAKTVNKLSVNPENISTEDLERILDHLRNL